jgi:hypothetical protein
MDNYLAMGDPDSLSRLELVSLYINGYYKLDADRRSKFEAAFRKRKLPLPLMPPEERRPAIRSPPGHEFSIDRLTFLSYLLLIYSGTAFFYSWIYLAERLIKMDFRVNTRHKLIQTGIALFYVTAEILIYGYFSNLP